MGHAFSYLIPHEIPLVIIIVLMWLLAIYVFTRFLRIRSRASKMFDALDKTKDVSILERVLLDDYSNPDNAFARFEEASGKQDGTEVLYEHIRAIFDAGHKSSRLDADLLVKNTVDKIFEGADFLKTAVSLFLVLGILGTLVGLTITIGDFSSVTQSVSKTIDAQDTNALQPIAILFTNLRSAFAPSMWGVFFTIVLVFSYSWFIQEACINRLTEALTHQTIKEWLPHLYPTDFQRSENSLAKLNATIDNADGINHGVRNLRKNLNESNESVRAFTKLSENMKAAAAEFSESIGKVSEIKELYTNLEKSNQSFIESVNKSQAVYDHKLETLAGKFDQVTTSVEKQMQMQVEAYKTTMDGLQTSMQTYFDGWQNSMGTVTESMKSCEKALETSGSSLQNSIEYQQEQRQQNEEFQKALQEYAEAVTDFSDRALKDLTQPVIDDLNKIANHQERIGTTISASMDRIKNPISESGKAFIDNGNKLVSAMETSVENVKKYTETIGTKMGAFETVANNIQAYTEKMDGTAKSLEEASKSLGSATEALKEHLENLSEKQEEFYERVAEGAPTESVNPEGAALGPDNKVQAHRVAKNGRKLKAKSLAAEESSVDVSNKQAGYVKMILSPQGIIACIIALLLLISMITQVVMVNKLSTVQHTQEVLTQQLIDNQKTTKDLLQKAVPTAQPQAAATQKQ